MTSFLHCAHKIMGINLKKH